MISLLQTKRTPIGIDIGSRVVKLVQLSADGKRVLEAAHWELPAERAEGPTDGRTQLVQALRQARAGKRFRGSEAVLCLSPRELSVQNVRVAKGEPFQVEQAARQEVMTRTQWSAQETELRFIDAADVRQTDGVKREVIVLACHQPKLDSMLTAVEEAGFEPVAVDVEPAALLRVYQRQYRREVDQTTRTMFVHMGNATTSVFITQGDEILFIKHLELGGQHFDEVVSRRLQMTMTEAAMLRRNNGDRRADQQDPEVAKSVAESCRPVLERLVNEISLCVRYHSVTFRGQPLKRLILAGGEANPAFVELLGARLDLKCEIGDPLRGMDTVALAGRRSQWDVALGLALRQVSAL